MTHGHFLDLTSVVVFGVRCVQLERLLQRSTVLGVKLDDISDTESDEEDERREGATVAEVRRGGQRCCCFGRSLTALGCRRC